MDKQQWHELPKQWLEEKRHPTSDEIIKYLRSLDWEYLASNYDAPNIIHELFHMVICAESSYQYDLGCRGL